jgi:hypothetical protein
MGIRLYPKTTNELSLEKLAGVTPGTTQRLQALRKEIGVDEGKDFFDNQDRYEKFHNAKTEEMDQLDSFLLFGWGKFDDAGVAIEEYGSLTDKEKIEILFKRNGIHADLDLCEGVYWG